MASHDIYLVISSDDSLATHPNNNAFSFIVDLPRSINLEGNWSCALQNFTFEANNGHVQNLFIYCDVCRESLVNEKYLPLLKMVTSTGDQSPLVFIPVSQTSFNNIMVNIRLENRQVPSFTSRKSTCAFLLRKLP